MCAGTGSKKSLLESSRIVPVTYDRLYSLCYITSTRTFESRKDVISESVSTTWYKLVAEDTFAHSFNAGVKTSSVITLEARQNSDNEFVEVKEPFTSIYVNYVVRVYAVRLVQ